MARIKLINEPTEAKIATGFNRTKGYIYDDAIVYSDGSALVYDTLIGGEITFFPHEIEVLSRVEPKFSTTRRENQKFDIGDTVRVALSNRICCILNVYYGLYTEDIAYFLDDCKFYFNADLRAI